LGDPAWLPEHAAELLHQLNLRMAASRVLLMRIQARLRKLRL
jgi:hypothetical protein